MADRPTARRRNAKHEVIEARASELPLESAPEMRVIPPALLPTSRRGWRVAVRRHHRLFASPGHQVLFDGGLRARRGGLRATVLMEAGVTVRAATVASAAMNEETVCIDNGTVIEEAGTLTAQTCAGVATTVLLARVQRYKLAAYVIKRRRPSARAGRRPHSDFGRRGSAAAAKLRPDACPEDEPERCLRHRTPGADHRAIGELAANRLNVTGRSWISARSRPRG